MSEGVLGAILAGGAGQRVGGADKGLLTIHGEPIAAVVAGVLKQQCGPLVIVANRNRQAYGRIGRVIGDRTPGHAGPLAGIEAALSLAIESNESPFTDCRWLLTVPVDCPDFPRDLCARLRAAMDANPGTHCVYAREDHKVQPLFALYSLENRKHLLASARDAVRVHASPLRWHLHLDAKPVDFADQTHAFRNLNALKDFTEYEAANPHARDARPNDSAPETEPDKNSAPVPQLVEGHPTRVGLELALEMVAARAAQNRVAIERVPLAEAAGRILAESMQALHALPPFANSAMDGFALRGSDLPAEGTRSFALIGEVLAGATSVPTVAAGECVRITTGAPLPQGADTVVIKENATVERERVSVRAGERPGANVRAAGEDYAKGDLAFAAGTPLGPAQVGVLSAFGIAEVPVRVRPRIAIIATGDELVAPGQSLGFGQIHESNATLLAALARDAGLAVTVQRCVRDDPEALRAVLLDAAADANLVVTSGGVSAGEADHLPRVLEAIGEIHFHKVRVKPGMPILFGQIGACLYFGLPGNPVSAAVTFRVFVRFAARALLGITTARPPGRARLIAPVQKRHARAEFLRCCLHVDETGVQWATPHAQQGSGMLRGLAESDALALLPDGEKNYQRGDVVTLWPG